MSLLVERTNSIHVFPCCLWPILLLLYSSPQENIHNLFKQLLSFTLQKLWKESNTYLGAWGDYWNLFKDKGKSIENGANTVQCLKREGRDFRNLYFWRLERWWFVNTTENLRGTVYLQLSQPEVSGFFSFSAWLLSQINTKPQVPSLIKHMCF